MKAEISIDKQQTTKLAGLSRIYYWSALGLFCLLCLLTYVRMSDIGSNPRTRIERMIYGTADKPFVMRALLPQTARLIVPLVRPELVDRLRDNQAVGPALDKLSLDYPVEAVSVLLLMYVSLIGFVIGLRLLMRGSGFPPVFVDLVPFPLVLIMLILFIPCAMIYDLAILALFTLCLAFIQDDRFSLFMVTFGLALLAKETAAVLVVIYAAWNWRSLNWRRVGELIALVILSRLLLMFSFANNPGSQVEFHLDKHFLAWEISPLHYVGSTALIGVFVLAAFWRWPLKPPFLRLALMICLPISFILWLFLGVPGELRVFLEVFPVGFLLLVWPYYRCETQLNCDTPGVSQSQGK